MADARVTGGWRRSVTDMPAVFRAQNFFGASLLLLLGMAVGCGDGLELSSVSGTVYLDEKPLPNAHVEFQPDQGSPSYGTTGQEGNFTLNFSHNRRGAIPGKHTVRIRTAGFTQDASGFEREMPETIPTRYNDKSELTQEVSPGKNKVEFRLTSQGELPKPAHPPRRPGRRK